MCCQKHAFADNVRQENNSARRIMRNVRCQAIIIHTFLDKLLSTFNLFF